MLCYLNSGETVMFSKTTLAAIAASSLSMLFFIAPPSQAAQVSFSDELELLNVDGHSNNNIDSSLELSPGSHVLVVRYRDLFEGVNADDPSTWVKSQPLFLQLVIDSNQITLAPPQLDDVNAAGNAVNLLMTILICSHSILVTSG